MDAWIRNLGQQWPLRPDSTSQQKEQQAAASSSSSESSEAPLSNLIQLQTLLTEASPQLTQWEKWMSLTSNSGASKRKRKEDQPQLVPVVEQEQSSTTPTTNTLASTSQQSSSSSSSSSQPSPLELWLSDASGLVGPRNIQTLIAQASSVLSYTRNETATLINAVNLTEMTQLATSLVDVAERLKLLRREGSSKSAGATKKQESQQSSSSSSSSTSSSSSSSALFSDFSSATPILAYSPTLSKAAEMGGLAGAIYEETLERTHDCNHSLVAQGLLSNIEWMVTDAIMDANDFENNTATKSKQQPILVRTLTIRGFDASDERVDREELLNQICSAGAQVLASPSQSTSSSSNNNPSSSSTPSLLSFAKQPLLFHSGLLQLANDIYSKVLQPYLVEQTAPTHKFILNGHSVGGSLALLLLMLLTAEKGVDYVRDRLLRVYTFGSPPIVAIPRSSSKKTTSATDSNPYSCEILTSMNLPGDLVHAFVQPWDPVVRLFSEIDALYPLIGDLGEDGFTPYATGPPRTLRPLLKRVLESWEGWPKFREIYRSYGSNEYRSVGIQHVLLPEPVRYVADRFIPVNVGVPPIASIWQLSSSQLLPALASVFPLDVFEISLVPQAIRSFVHHFYPAYNAPIQDYVRRLEKEKNAKKSPAAAGKSNKALLGNDDDDEDGPCTVIVLQQEDGSSVVVDVNQRTV